MPNIAPPVIQKYRTRILIKATSETKRYWTEYRIVTFLASPILAAIWPWHGLTLTTFAFIVFRALLIFFAIWCVTFFYSLLRASPPRKQKVAGVTVRIWTAEDIERLRKYKEGNYCKGRGRKPQKKSGQR